MNDDIVRKLRQIKGLKTVDEQVEALKEFAKEGMKIGFPDEEFNALVQYELETVMKTKGDCVLSHMLVFGIKDDDGNRPACYVSFGDFPEQDKKLETFRGIGLKFAAESPALKPIMAVLVSEAWTRTLSKEEAEERDRSGKNVSDYADKKEIVIVSGLTIDGRDQTFIISVKRDKDNNILFDKPSEVQHGENNLLKAFFEGYSMGAVLGDKGGVN